MTAKRKAAEESPLPHRSLGAPRMTKNPGRYVTQGGVTIDCEVSDLPDSRRSLDQLITRLDSERGCIFESSYEFPGRYARWTMGFVNPPLVIEASGRTFEILALNERGALLLPAVYEALQSSASLREVQIEAGTRILGEVRPVDAHFAEEERSRQNSIFSLIRSLRDFFHCEHEPMLGLYGAFGYDLTFQFEPVTLSQQRDGKQRDLVLYLPDELLVIDIHTKAAWRLLYEFTVQGRSSTNLPRVGSSISYIPKSADEVPARRDHRAGQFAEKVQMAKEEFKVGNLFEVVLSQTFIEPCPDNPSVVFSRLRLRNPSPYGFLINLGATEYLVGASPEMFVRVEKDNKGWRCETCPISGTIKRGRDALEDAENIRTILSDKKEESELTMCTDVDRNDKSRICRAGSVTVIGRRQIEMYSRVIHTVDHVEGYLRSGFDAMDAFLCHTWAVTVTGAPKAWAIQFVEDHEESPRNWYGGAVGMIGFDGGLNTGLTLRTVHVSGGVARVRAGATLLFDSEPSAEEAETELKASAMRDAVLRPDTPPTTSVIMRPPSSNANEHRVLLVDHQDSFVHTLANYLRQTGAQVTTLRAGFPTSEVKRLDPTLAVLSPGPGCPRDFNLSGTIELMMQNRVPIFGVCLGLQGIVEHFGGELGVLAYPQHGKPGQVSLTSEAGVIFDGMPKHFQVGRYHSLYSLKSKHPPELSITAETNDGIIMGIQHTSLPLAAVQFHPESILTRSDLGLQMLINAVSDLHY
mmetsp:Transcript_52610/g.87349  ORF Transcript_52610/g.87349 Transcript_52610/m.87349 type:complete len:749 (-) Transcript_52610:296-2542(-)|eukprot:CAMPEP_0119318074 /NCGR_PEP_ID=MMETSP1333-20130426/45365_1 /TAXON_ID=418940 /ORGANISM="Scyphosphaera apsteinii, Strain RCC1455" /LENGTH=748 /DNA_ID=CAMNT_0007324175 /DNA_START=43 /DNA_END=2289 /DNA_ORIENTATION=+